MTTIRTPRVTFARVVRSEWIKLLSIRSTVATAIVAAGLTAMFAGLVVLGIVVGETEGGVDAAETIAGTFGDQPTPSMIAYTVMFTQAFAAVLGVLVVTSERASGVISATVAAVARRRLIVLAKLTVSGIAGFALGAVTVAITVAIAHPVFSANTDAGSLLSAGVLQSVAGAALYFALISMISTGIGFLVRGTAPAAGIALGLLLIVPGLIQLIPAIGPAVASALPTALGQALYLPVEQVGVSALIVGGAGILAWVLAAGTGALASFTRRDV